MSPISADRSFPYHCLGIENIEYAREINLGLTSICLYLVQSIKENSKQNEGYWMCSQSRHIILRLQMARPDHDMIAMIVQRSHDHSSLQSVYPSNPFPPLHGKIGT